MKKQTAVEWLVEQLENHNGVTRAGFEKCIQEAKEMEKEQKLMDMQEYAEFCIMCDRKQMPLLLVEDYYKDKYEK